MTSTNEKYTVFKNKDKVVEYEVIQPRKLKNRLLLAAHNILKTRIRKDNHSTYATTSPREIKKWFESRGI